MLAIEVEFLTSRYVATAYNNRFQPEWPPHPARLFSALVATHFAAEPADPDERTVLEWLAAQDAPAIHASEASAREIATVYVRVNDVAFTNVDSEAEDVERARIELEVAQAGGGAREIRRATTTLRKAEERLAKAIRASTGVGGGSPCAALRVLPEYRTRQPRTFPSVTPTDPRVTYVWPSVTLDEAQHRTLDGLLARLVRLGHSSSLVRARIVGDPPAPVWWPAVNGERTLRTVHAGQLEALEEAFSRHRETEPRVMPARFTRYTREQPTPPPPEPATVFSDDWLVLRRVGGPAIPMEATVGVARTLRKALLAHAPEIPEILSGHTADGRPSERDHLAIVPLPFVAHRHASGALLGFALVLPRAAGTDERRAVYAAVAAWEAAARCEDEETPRLPLHLGAAGVLELERLEFVAPQASLRAATWCGPARVWHSATPVALDHHPGDLHSRDAAKLAKAIAEAVASIRRACARIGLPEPEAVEVLPAPALAGAAKARRYPPYPDREDRTRRLLTHVRLEFASPVRGPVLLGAGRYVGLGLFRPDVYSV